MNFGTRENNHGRMNDLGHQIFNVRPSFCLGRGLRASQATVSLKRLWVGPGGPLKEI
jgi:hypothetical protein